MTGTFAAAAGGVSIRVTPGYVDIHAGTGHVTLTTAQWAWVRRIPAGDDDDPGPVPDIARYRPAV